MPVFISSGTNLFYDDQGEGFPLILLHGLTSNHQMFYKEIDFFKENFRVIALDSRGHGKSERPEHYTLSDHVEDTIALLNHLDIESCHIIGVSMGSYIAQGVAIRVPDRVQKLVLVATKPCGDKSSMNELYEEYADEMEGMNALDKMNHASQYMFHNHQAVGKWLKETARNSQQLTMEERKSAALALRNFDFRDELGKIQAETMVISGTHDGLNPPEKGRETAVLIPNASYLEFRKSGHAPNVEQEMLFLGIVENFLD
ncbi:MAG TPA: alpha/beta fold hydrolase [Planococcus sp. (in: firmicutes)]|nr:alpha/beta fold hydrolase [Planococcus sp. (in: firmicutes)]